jgi:hypothetical protein
MLGVEEAAFDSALNAGISEALRIADRSPTFSDEEVSLATIVALLVAHPEHREAAEGTLVDLPARLEENPAPLGLVELLSYCVHVVGFPSVVEAARARHAAAVTEYASGGSGRRWEHARAMERVIDADSPGWEDADVFDTLGS